MEGLLAFDLTTILFCLIVVLFVSYVWSQKEVAGVPPGPTFLPILGNILDIRGKYLRKRHQYFYELKQKYGDICRIYLGSKMVVLLNSYDLIYEAFVKKKEIFTDRPTHLLWGVKKVHPKGKAGLIWANGEDWKNVRRRSLQTLRDLGVGKSTLDTKIQEESEFLLDELDKSSGKPFDMSEVLIKATTNVITQVVFGERFEYEHADLIDIIAVLKLAFKGEGFFGPLHFFPVLALTPILYSQMKSLKKRQIKMDSFFEKRIKEHEDSLDSNNVRDFIDICLLHKEESSNITHPNLVRAIKDLFLAGTDTTSCTLDWTILYMILYPDIQKKCQEEIDDVVGSNRMVNWADRVKMPYIEATLTEAQRLANTVPLTVPHMSTEDSNIGGYVIPKNSIVYGNTYAAHLDTNYWDEPFVFKPERFLGEANTTKRNPAFLPFSIGPRVCPGESLAKMELFVFFTNMIQKFTFSKYGTEDLSTEGVFGISMSPVSYKCAVERR